MFLPQHRCLLVFIMMVLLTINVFALDVSFIPNSENEPLPLSAKYRDSLRKLCVLIKNEGAVLPPELLEKKAVLEKVCSKLEKDDQNIDGSKPGGKFSRTKQTILYGLIGLGSGYYLWTNRAWLKSKLRNTPNTSQRNILGRGDASTTSSIVTDSETLVADSVGVDAGHVINSSPVVHSPVIVEAKTVGADKIAEARAARLKRFSEMNSVNVNVQ